MKYTYYILAVLMLLAVSCSNRKHPSEYYPQGTYSYDSYTEPVRHDSVRQEAPVQQPSHTTSSSSGKHYDDDALELCSLATKGTQELDNMRGFDPALEDDMDDNGMQRYFDANDDEAWD